MSGSKLVELIVNSFEEMQLPYSIRKNLSQDLSNL